MNIGDKVVFTKELRLKVGSTTVPVPPGTRGEVVTLVPSVVVKAIMAAVGGPPVEREVTLPNDAVPEDYLQSLSDELRARIQRG